MNELISIEIETAARVLSAWFYDDRFQRAWHPDPTLFVSKQHRALADVFAGYGPGLSEERLLLELHRRNTLKLFDRPEAVLEFLQGTPAVVDPWAQVERLREVTALRALRNGLTLALGTIGEGKSLADAQNAVSDAVTAAAAALGSKAVTVRQALANALAQATRVDMPQGCETGSAKLDRWTGGIQPAYVWVFGADTNWGKSSWLVLLADVNLHAGRRVLIVSGEDPEELYSKRLLARRAGFNAWRMRDRNLSQGEISDGAAVVSAAEDSPFFLDGRGKTAEAMAAEMRSVVLGEGVHLVMVDYIQAFRVAKKCQDRPNEVAHVARTFTDAIKLSGAAGVLASQITDQDGKANPDKHSIRYSRDVSHGAEVVLLGYSEKEHVLDGHGRKTGVENEKKMVFLDKNKDGPRGIRLELTWNKLWAGFEAEDDPGNEGEE